MGGLSVRPITLTYISGDSMTWGPKTQLDDYLKTEPTPAHFMLALLLRLVARDKDSSDSS